MAKQVETWIDANGQAVPVNRITPYEKARNRAVCRVVKAAGKARAILEAFMAEAIREMDALARLKESLGEKGNFSARSFDGLFQVSIRQQYNIRLDERVCKARELMLDYANRELAKTGDSAFLLKQMVEAAFKTDRFGFLPRSEVTKLLSYVVKDDAWNEGAAILRQALTTERGKRYLRVETRISVQHDFVPIRLDAADCWPGDMPTA